MRKLSDRDKIDIVTKYKTGKFNCLQLANEYGVTRNNIKKILNNRGITQLHHRHYSVNQHYFDVIDTEAKAYFLGLLYADGCISDRDEMILSLQEKDINILLKFKSEMESQHPIYIQTLKNPNYQKSCRFSIRNKFLANQLITLGCIPRKSLILKFPQSSQVPDHLIHHFVRGYFDGDGCLVITYYKNCGIMRWSHIVTFLGTEEFCGKLSLIISRVVGKSPHHRNGLGKSEKIMSLTLGGKIEVARLYEWMYGNATIYLQRKYDKFQEFFKIKDENAIRAQERKDLRKSKNA